MLSDGVVGGQVAGALPIWPRSMRPPANRVACQNLGGGPRRLTETGTRDLRGWLSWTGDSAAIPSARCAALLLWQGSAARAAFSCSALGMCGR